MQERMTALESNCKIELVNVTKRFGKVIANDSVNLTIEGGKVLCLLGENGSGKTTLMNVLSVGHRRQRAVQHDDQHVHRKL